MEKTLKRSPPRLPRQFRPSSWTVFWSQTLNGRRQVQVVDVDRHSSLFRAGSARLFSDNSIVSLKLQGRHSFFCFLLLRRPAVRLNLWKLRLWGKNCSWSTWLLCTTTSNPSGEKKPKKKPPFTSGNECDERRRQGLQGRAKYKTHVGLYLCTRFLSRQLQPRCATITKS